MTAQEPKAGVKLTVGSLVRLNVSKGPQPIVVPSVVGEPFDQAAPSSRRSGFKVQPRFVDDNQPANTVIGQSPSAGGTAGKGSVISLTVSKGPKTSTVPDVTSYDLGLGRAAAPGVRLQVAGDRAGRVRPEPGRHRALAGPGRRRAGRAEDRRAPDRRATTPTQTDTTTTTTP